MSEALAPPEKKKHTIADLHYEKLIKSLSIFIRRYYFSNVMLFQRMKNTKKVKNSFPTVRHASLVHI
ncbi:hypothetical protein [Chryseobacterium sp. MEBOG07]|uniref:hypothetical protein n=1 Tax=Chryseobacterium sp. MEBOG07 TaxID=2879939 RepID=UPI00397B5A0C